MATISESSIYLYLSFFISFYLSNYSIWYLLPGTSLATISETSLLSTTATSSADNSSIGKDATQSLFGGISAKLEVNSSGT